MPVDDGDDDDEDVEREPVTQSRGAGAPTTAITAIRSDQGNSSLSTAFFMESRRVADSASAEPSGAVSSAI